jgi:thiosulfate/3-mercaptopyruvate sulfurtransferase
VVRRTKVRKKLVIGAGSIALALVLVLVLVIGTGALAGSSSRAIDPIVSTQWLEENLSNANLVILDVRNPDEYAAAHIPGAINSPEWMWYVSYPFQDPPPWLELPTVEALTATIRSAGITGNSLVVIAGRTVDSSAGPAVYALAGATRVADTLIYAGIKNVAILDGGYDKWVAEDRATSDVPVTPTPSTYVVQVNEKMFVSMDYVQKVVSRSPLMQFLVRSVIVDGRDADVYFGVTQEPWTPYPGHIPGATSLPVPWLWNLGADYSTYKNTAVLSAMAAGVVCKNFAPREIIVYCGVGGYASTAYFVLSEVLGYKNVKIYDGSAQEWTLAGKPVVMYQWE